MSARMKMGQALFPRSAAARVPLSAAALFLLSAAGTAGCGGPAPTAGPPARVATAVPASEAGLTTVTGKAPRGAVVVLEPVTPREFPVPATPVVMDQLGKQFIPGVLLARAGQPVEFRNSEDTPHNVYVKRSPIGREIFNVSTDPYQKYVHTFDEPGLYEVSCDVHPGMAASVVVSATPYAVVVDETGRFSMVNVAPGPYRLVTTSQGKRDERNVTVTGPHVVLDIAPL